MQERAEVIKHNREDIEGLCEKRSNAEQAFLERYMAAAEAYEKQLDDLRCADAEDYNLLKVRCVPATCTEMVNMYMAAEQQMRTGNTWLLRAMLSVAIQHKAVFSFRHAAQRLCF